MTDWIRPRMPTRSPAGTASEDAERSPSTQAARLVEQGLQIDGDPALHFIHVVLPHAPWFITPVGHHADAADAGVG